MVSGFVNIDKPGGLTSHDVVNKVRRMFNTKAVGHMGTLDPQATGVLPIALGSATRLIPYVEGSTKEYIAELVLGITTDTLDLEGDVLAASDASHMTEADIRRLLPLFLGQKEQLPPMYSAVKVGGKKLYEYARAGISVAVKPRLVEISSLELLAFTAGERATASLSVTCSKGTYIRALCRDIGLAAGVPACMGTLRRIASGPFRLEHSVSLVALCQQPTQHVVSVADMLRNGTELSLSLEEARRFIQGQQIKAASQAAGLRSVFCDEVFLGIGEISQHILQPKKVLAREGDIQ